MGRLNDVCNTIKSQIVTVVNAAGITTPSQAAVGWPNFDDLTKILQQVQYLVTVYPQPNSGRSTTRFQPQWMQVAAPVVNLVATVNNGNSITFSGTPPPTGAVYNIHTIVGTPKQDAFYQATGTDTLTTIATAVAAAINALGLSGITASSASATVTIAGNVTNLRCNVGGTAQLAREVRRVTRVIQVTVWAPNPSLRESVTSAIEDGIGTILKQFIPMSDGSNIWIRWHGSHWDDNQQQDFSMYVGHIYFSVEYGSFEFQTATQVEGTKETYQNLATGATIATLITGG